MCDVEFTARPRQRVLPCRAVSPPCSRTVTRGLTPPRPSPAFRPSPSAINNSRRIIASRRGVSPLDEINLHVFFFLSLDLLFINPRKKKHTLRLLIRAGSAELAGIDREWCIGPSRRVGGRRVLSHSGIITLHYRHNTLVRNPLDPFDGCVATKARKARPHCLNLTRGCQLFCLYSIS